MASNELRMIKGSSEKSIFVFILERKYVGTPIQFRNFIDLTKGGIGNIGILCNWEKCGSFLSKEGFFESSSMHTVAINPIEKLRYCTLAM